MTCVFILGKSGSASATPKKAAKVTDFEVEQARNGMSKCRECGNKILKVSAFLIKDS